MTDYVKPRIYVPAATGAAVVFGGNRGAFFTDVDFNYDQSTQTLSVPNVVFEEMEVENLDVTADLTVEGDTLLKQMLGLLGGVELHDLVRTFANTGYVATDADLVLLWDTSGGSCAMSLPAIAGVRNMLVYIQKATTDANTLTITPAAGTIGGAASVVVGFEGGVLLYAPAAGTDWKILSQSQVQNPTFAGPVTLSSAFNGHSVSKTFANTGYVVLATDYIIGWDTSGGACAQPLPDINTMRGRILKIIKITTDGNAVTITPAAGTIGAAGTLVLAGGAVRAAELYAPPAGTDWWIL